MFVCFLFEKYRCSRVSNKIKILPYGFSLKCLRTISADSSGDIANDQVLTEFIPFSEPCVGVKSVIDQTWTYNLDLQVYANKSQTMLFWLHETQITFKTSSGIVSTKSSTGRQRPH